MRLRIYRLNIDLWSLNSLNIRKNPVVISVIVNFIDSYQLFIYSHSVAIRI